MSRTIRQAAALLVVATVAVAAIVALHGARTPVVPRPDAATPGGAGLYERIQISMAAATTRNDQALALCESDINAVLSREFSEITREGGKAVAEVASYSSCCGIIGRLAKDQVFGGTSASAYVDQELGGRLRPALHTCSQELDAALARFDRSLAESTVTLASELAQARDASGNDPVTVAVDVRYSDDLDTALRSLGFDSAGVGVGLALDVWGLINSRLAQGLLTKATGMAASMFARPAAAAAAEMTVAVADGPLPIGDAIALVGGLWTAYDIYATRAAFETELKTTLANALPDMKRSVHDQVMTRIRGTLDAHRRVQDSIRTACTNGITH
jgi:hypothetical protein